jgi:ankyrin repeat protein
MNMPVGFFAAKSNARCLQNDFELVNLLIEFGCSINVADHKGWTPLHYAVSYNRLQVIETLLHKSAVLNATNREGYTPLHVAALQCNDKLVELLAELNGADTNTRSTDGQVRKPMQIAYQRVKNLNHPHFVDSSAPCSQKREYQVMQNFIGAGCR